MRIWWLRKYEDEGGSTSIGYFLNRGNAEILAKLNGYTHYEISAHDTIDDYVEDLK